MATKRAAPKPNIIRRSAQQQKALDDFVDGQKKPLRPKRGKASNSKKSKASKTSKIQKSKNPETSKTPLRRKTGKAGRPAYDEERVQMTVYLPRDVRDKLRKRALEESLRQERKIPETDIVIDALRAHL